MSNDAPRNPEEIFKDKDNFIIQEDAGPAKRRSHDSITGEVHILEGKVTGKKMGDAYERTKPALKEEHKAKRDEATTSVYKLKQSSGTIHDECIEGDIGRGTILYRPKTQETRQTYKVLLSVIQACIEEQPRDVLCRAADEILDVLKNDRIKEKQQKREVENLLGPISEKRFSRLVNLSKKITDFEMNPCSDGKDGASGEEGIQDTSRINGQLEESEEEDGQEAFGDVNDKVQENDIEILEVNESSGIQAQNSGTEYNSKLSNKEEALKVEEFEGQDNQEVLTINLTGRSGWKKSSLEQDLPQKKRSAGEARGENPKSEEDEGEETSVDEASSFHSDSTAENGGNSSAGVKEATNTQRRKFKRPLNLKTTSQSRKIAAAASKIFDAVKKSLVNPNEKRGRRSRSEATIKKGGSNENLEGPELCDSDEVRSDDKVRPSYAASTFIISTNSFWNTTGKRKRGRPRKEDTTPKRKRGRPRKVTATIFNSSTSAVSEKSVLGPVGKRKRGRPRKVATVKSDDGNSELKRVYDSDGGQNDEGARILEKSLLSTTEKPKRGRPRKEDTTPKRKRGRPRKVTATILNEDTDDTLECQKMDKGQIDIRTPPASAASTSKFSETLTTTGKLKPGRPRKETVSTSAVLEKSVLDQIGKHKRGRPRKRVDDSDGGQRDIRTPLASAASTRGILEKSILSTHGKRKRGRPRKEDTTPKRKRGRPRKVTATILTEGSNGNLERKRLDDSDGGQRNIRSPPASEAPTRGILEKSILSTNGKRKRGRPRKEDMTPKRKRGRPRKVTATILIEDNYSTMERLEIDDSDADQNGKRTPPASAASTSEISENVDTTEKRKRGRPRKVVGRIFNQSTDDNLERQEIFDSDGGGQDNETSPASTSSISPI